MTEESINDEYLQIKLKAKYEPFKTFDNKSYNGWWIADFIQDSNQIYKYMYGYQYERRVMQTIAVDDQLSCCKKCNKIWEIVPEYIGRKHKIAYYEIPKLGKKEKTCPKCD
tara:strand:+ start:6078 stop:6410 length:333 start_codon:yes stop_codon:yes gene_type:complete